MNTVLISCELIDIKYNIFIRTQVASIVFRQLEFVDLLEETTILCYLCDVYSYFIGNYFIFDLVENLFRIDYFFLLFSEILGSVALH